MSETRSLPPSEQTRDAALRSDASTLSATRVGEAALFERLGTGGMGEVYRYTDDALGRDLAIKILKAELRGDGAAEERFLREARLTGSLQHPGIVPIHNLGRLADGRPCYTMKLVRGRTLADLLRDEPAGPERLPRLLAVVEKVCQAVAFAHSKGVIHRDLKPSNIMVGEFGEVQVMDWGLAKELSRVEPALPDEATADVETVARTEEAAGLSRAGLALGTPSFMPPEQAAGDWDIVDERADVFALGAILCEVLTGRPPYHGAGREDLLRRARRGDLAEAFERLQKCGADSALTGLCRACLAAERLQRPRHAGAVAERLAAYQSEVRERLRQAELQRARAEVKALEERKRRRLLAVLALTALLLLLGGGAVTWQWQRRRAEADGIVAVAMGEARLLLQQAQADPLTAGAYDKAIAAAQKSRDMARAGGASEVMERQADDLLAVVRQEAEQAAKDRRLLARLLEAHAPREGPKYNRGDKGTMMALAEPTAEEQFASAFRDWGLDVDTVPLDEAAARLKARPVAVVMEMIAALDEWAVQRRADKMPEEAWRRVADLASGLDDDSTSLRRELREILARDRLAAERAVEMLSAALRPVPVPIVLPLGKDHVRLHQLAERIDPAKEPLLALLTLTWALRVAGDEATAERLLRAAIQVRPREVVLYHRLGQLLREQEPPRWSAAVECYTAARALRPDLGVTLAEALRRSDREPEALSLLARLVEDNPDNPYLRFEQGLALRENGDMDGALACFQKAIELDPKYAAAHNNRGLILKAKGDVEGALAYYKRTIALFPKFAPVHCNLGAILCDHKGDYDGAIACFHKSIALDPTDAIARCNLGAALANTGDLAGAITCFRKAIELDSKFAHAYRHLGRALRTKGNVNGAIVCYKKAINLDPKYANAHNDLGLALSDKGDVNGAIACYQKAIKLDDTYAAPYSNIGMILCDIKHDYDGAIACFHKALGLDPKNAITHHNLGVALHGKGDVDGAIGCLRKAIELDPKYAQAHYTLGHALRDKGDVKGAIASYKKSIDLNPKHAESHCNLGLIFQEQGRFTEAVTSLRRGHELGSKQPGWSYPSAEWLRDAERQAVLAGKLPAILDGAAAPANPGEAADLAHMCLLNKKRYAAAARLYAEAFAADPKLAADGDAQHRYSAACSAALAAAGQGKEAHLLPDKAVTMFRYWSLSWLREDLTYYSRIIGKDNAALKQTVRERLSHWQRDSDLASVRDPQALARLPDNERAAWQALWRDVDELLRRVANQDTGK